jgi:5-methylcytosine-specific restriction endonuclease McrA
MKTCTECNTEKPLAEFYFRKDQQNYRANCKTCFKARKALRESRPGVKEERARKERQRRIDHKDRINTTLREQRMSNRLRHKVNAASRNSFHKRRTAMKDGITTQELIKWRAEQYPFCAYCGSGSSLTLDHITPLSKGGTHTTDNLVLACSACNSSKYNNGLLYWLAARQQLNEVKDKKP